MAGSSTTYTGVKQQTRIDIKYGDYGSRPGVSFTLIVEIADFTALPADNTGITIDGVSMQILAVERDPANLKAFFHIGDLQA